MTNTPQSIAILRLSAIGDVLMYVPTVRALQKSFPGAKLYWIISNPAYQLVKNIENINFIVIEKPRSFVEHWKLYKKFKQYHFDILLASQASMRTNLLYLFISAKKKIGYDFIRGKEGHAFLMDARIPFKKTHTLQGFMQFAEYIGADITEVIWNLPIDLSAQEWVGQFLLQNQVHKGPVIVINPAASKPERSWLPERYKEVIRYLQNKYSAQVILCGGPSEFDRQLANKILNEVDVLDLVGKTQLIQLMALIDRADLVICPDTGPSHMAAAVNTPVIALHAVTKPEISGPYGQLHHVINYYPEAKQRYGKTKKIIFTQKSWFDKVHHAEVMNLIQVHDVIAKIDEIL